MSTTPPTPRPASTVLLLRDSHRAEREIEVFMMVRHYQIEFVSGALVFPGGSVDANDREIITHPELYSGNEGFDPQSLSFRIGGIRETFEESGILLARQRGSKELIDAKRAGEIEQKYRTALCENKVTFLEVTRESQIELAIDLMVPYAHWITPEMMPKRFDTWFFLAAAPPDQVGTHDGKESTDSIWLSPREAVEGGESGRFSVPFPTVRNLIRLGKHQTVQSALDDSRGRPIVTVLPKVVTIEGGRRLHIPAEAGYDGDLFEVAEPDNKGPKK